MGCRAVGNSSVRAGKGNLNSCSFMHVADKRLKNTPAIFWHTASLCAENLAKVVKTNTNTVSPNEEILKKHTPLEAYLSTIPLICLSLSKHNYFGSI